MNYNIVYYENDAYQILTDIAIHHFQNKDGSVNKNVLGMFVNEYKADRVLQKDHKFLICKKIEEAQIVE
jgi:hypothetical protein